MYTVAYAPLACCSFACIVSFTTHVYPWTPHNFIQYTSVYTCIGNGVWFFQAREEHGSLWSLCGHCRFWKNSITSEFTLQCGGKCRTWQILQWNEWQIILLGEPTPEPQWERQAQAFNYLNKGKGPCPSKGCRPEQTIIKKEITPYSNMEGRFSFIFQRTKW